MHDKAIPKRTSVDIPNGMTSLWHATLNVMLFYLLIHIIYIRLLNKVFHLFDLCLFCRSYCTVFHWHLVILSILCCFNFLDFVLFSCPLWILCEYLSSLVDIMLTVVSLIDVSLPIFIRPITPYIFLLLFSVSNFKVEYIAHRKKTY